jgi:hypothetical protein
MMTIGGNSRARLLGTALLYSLPSLFFFFFFNTQSSHFTCSNSNLRLFFWGCRTGAEWQPPDLNCPCHVQNLASYLYHLTSTVGCVDLNFRDLLAFGGDQNLTLSKLWAPMDGGDYEAQLTKETNTLHLG